MNETLINDLKQGKNMAKARKHQFHCEKCASPCEIYKKGKNHRVLVCPSCGVLATNPFSLGRAISGATTGAAVGSAVPGIGTAAGAVVGALGSGFTGGEKESKPTMQTSVNRFTTEERVKVALGSR